jgi:hypothetical protein
MPLVIEVYALVCLRLSLQVHGNEDIQIMSFMSNHFIQIIHVKSFHSCQIMSFFSNHVIPVKSCHSCQIMSFMSNHVIRVKSCLSFVIRAFSEQTFTKVGREGGGGVKYVFLGLRRQLRCLAEGKNIICDFTSWWREMTNSEWTMFVICPSFAI